MIGDVVIFGDTWHDIVMQRGNRTFREYMRLIATTKKLEKKQ